MKWFRLYGELLHDRKIARIARTEQLSKCTVLGAWVGILMLANESPERGYLMLTEGIPLDTEEIGDALGLYDSDLTYLLGAFIACNMLSDNDGYLSITNWTKRQFKSDDSAARVKLHREKEEKQSTKPLQKRYSNALDTETDTETDTEDKDISAPSNHYHEIRKVWKDLFPDRPQPRKGNKTLTKKAKTRMGSQHFREHWQEALVLVSQAPPDSYALAGTWFTLNWFLLNDDNYEKCLNGNYNNSPGANGQASEPAGFAAGRKILEDIENGRT